LADLDTFWLPVNFVEQEKARTADAFRWAEAGLVAFYWNSNSHSSVSRIFRRFLSLQISMQSNLVLLHEETERNVVFYRFSSTSTKVTEMFVERIKSYSRMQQLGSSFL
jgi:hypothetical protein